MPYWGQNKSSENELYGVFGPGADPGFPVGGVDPFWADTFQ